MVSYWCGQIEMVWTCAEEGQWRHWRMLEMELPGRRPRGRPKSRWMDAVREDMQVVGVRVEDTNRSKWKAVIGCGNPWKGKRCKEKNDFQMSINVLCLFSKQAFLFSNGRLVWKYIQTQCLLQYFLLETWGLTVALSGRLPKTSALWILWLTSLVNR